ncbi:VRR-NUC domain-containing protein [Caulobacter sp. UNC279MFTsu5.1]|nr:VRR-NUC domain-containing protein [Caulobacter sp. UNC279MFTsu5.1]
MGATSKIKRYYWRELFFEEMRRFDDWEVAHPDADEDAKVLAQAEIAAAVLAEIKALHEASPKYVYTEVSDQEVLTRYKVEIENLTAEYAPKGRKGAIIQVGDEVISPEAFAIEHYRAQGLEAIPLESVPFMSLFAVMMALVICDTLDDQVRFCGFGNRDDYEAGRPCRQIWASLPEDFGKPTYADRRAAKLKRFFAELPDDRFTLLWTYDYFRGVSYELRQYLWVHKDVDFDRGRMLIERLSPAAIVKILQYLIGDYWGRHLGWPDLLVLGGEDGAFFLAEVKSSKDSLSEEQKRWIADNDEHLGFPFRIVKIHRSNPDRKASASTRT